MSRQDVLALLREQEGAFVSGEEISHRLGLSRAAIWKAVDALRREGYTVEARTGRGYRLLDAPDVLTEPEIRRFLGETARVQELVLGIGINVSQRPEDFTPEVREIATSLVQALGHAVSRPALAAEIIREVDRLCAALAAGETGPYLAEYRRRCVNLGRTVRLLRPDGGGETAEALDIDEEFGLVVRRPDGAVKTVRSGEVSVRGLYGYTE